MFPEEKPSEWRPTEAGATPSTSPPPPTPTSPPTQTPTSTSTPTPTSAARKSGRGGLATTLVGVALFGALIGFAADRWAVSNFTQSPLGSVLPTITTGPRTGPLAAPNGGLAQSAPQSGGDGNPTQNAGNGTLPGARSPAATSPTTPATSTGTNALSSDPTQAAIQQVIQKGDNEQAQAFASSDPTVMQDTATPDFYQTQVSANQDLKSNGVTAISLANLEWGQISVNAGGATATAWETWTTTYSDGTTEQSRVRNVYTLVQQNGGWLISADDHPDDDVAAGQPGRPTQPGQPGIATQPGQPGTATQPGQPDITATQPGQPDITATQPGQPDITATQPGQPDSTATQPGQPGAAGQPGTGRRGRGTGNSANPGTPANPGNPTRPANPTIPGGNSTTPGGNSTTPGDNPTTPGGTPGGSRPGVPSGQDVSQNWSGYATTGGTYTSVSGTWTVPQFAPDSPAGADATWVGIGGVNSRDLIQAGTQQTVSGTGSTQYQAWVETLPQASHPVPLAVNPGDSISISITRSPSAHDQWQVAYTNNTTGQTYQVTEHYTSSMSSAEWIEEAPSAARGRQLPLDNFGSVTFTQGSAVKNGQTVSIADSGAQPISMVARNSGARQIARPSTLSADGAGFTVTQG